MQMFLLLTLCRHASVNFENELVLRGNISHRHVKNGFLIISNFSVNFTQSQIFKKIKLSQTLYYINTFILSERMNIINNINVNKTAETKSPSKGYICCKSFLYIIQV